MNRRSEAAGVCCRFSGLSYFNPSLRFEFRSVARFARVGALCIIIYTSHLNRLREHLAFRLRESWYSLFFRFRSACGYR